MNPDLVVPIVSSIAWLVLACVGLASFQLGWGQMVKMALAWVAIFLGLFLIVQWFLVAQNTASGLL